MLITAFSPYLTMFSTHPKKGIIILTILNVSSAHAFNLDQCKILSLGKELLLSGKLACHDFQSFDLGYDLTLNQVVVSLFSFQTLYQTAIF